jgi:hypothetical protein
MAKPKAQTKPRGNPKFIPDLLSVHVDIEVIRNGARREKRQKIKYGGLEEMVGVSFTGHIK